MKPPVAPGVLAKLKKAGLPIPPELIRAAREYHRESTRRRRAIERARIKHAKIMNNGHGVTAVLFTFSFVYDVHHGIGFPKCSKNVSN